LSPDEQIYAIKTWRYLRLTMVVLVAGLAVAVGFERAKVHPGCFQRSISAYYYTPVHGVFVGSLIAIGVCLVCLKGNTEHEDILLNLAGMFAPVVALVPTPGTGTCASVLGTTQDRDVNVANNVFALLVTGTIALIVVALLVVRDLVTDQGWPSVPKLVAFGVSATLLLASWLVFELARRFFTGHAHYTAAILLFVCILVVVGLNAVGWKRKSDGQVLRNRYTAIAIAMMASVVGISIAGFLGWQHAVLAVEASLISLFALFWIIQTKELWHDGIR
jgi:uncharacterized membrane protein SirB2